MADVVVQDPRGGLGAVRERASRLWEGRPKQAWESRTRASGSAVTQRWWVASVALLALWLLLSALMLSALEQHSDQGRLYDQFRRQLADGTAPLGPADAGQPVALLQSQRAGLADTVVVEGSASRDTQLGPGHRRSSPLPGQPGTSVVLGRSTTFGAPFRSLTALQPGDRVTATTGQGVFIYVVRGLRHAGDPVPPAVATGGSRLTLMSTEPGGWRNLWIPSRTVFADADLQGTSQLPAAPHPASVSAAEQLMAGDHTGLVGLLLWLEALALAAVAVGWAVARWGRWQAWVAGVPVLVAVLWGATSAAFPLLPNVV